jgi:hypothetical protein
MAPSLSAHTRDFLHIFAETPLTAHYLAAGAVCALSTNSPFLVEALRESFLPLTTHPAKPDISLRLWVDGADSPGPPWPKPYLRGLDNLVFAGFDAKSSLLADLATRTVVGRFSAGMASDTNYWRTTILPMLLSIISGSVGIVELHASCVATDEQGLIFVGPSRSGKSTIAMALVKAGFRLLSDDRVFCSLQNGEPLAYGLPRPLKLRRDAGTWFDEWKDREPTDVQNGENVFFWTSDHDAGKSGLAPCEPRALIFLEREEDATFRLTPMDRNEVQSRIESELLVESREAVQKQEETLGRLLELPCCRLTYGVSPEVVAGNLRDLLQNSLEGNPFERVARGGTT